MSIEWFDRSKGERPVVHEHDPAWVARAAAWIARVTEALRPLPARVEHIGSTAVDGLAAKPVIDLQVALPRIDDEDSYRPALEALGLTLRLREPDHRFFRPPSDQPRTVHVHVCEHRSDCERRHLLFRDFLRAEPASARAYGELKRDLAARAGDDRLAYANGKRPFIDVAMRAAEAWAQRTGWTPLPA